MHREVSRNGHLKEVPKEAPRKRTLLPATLFILTVITTVIAGTLHEGLNPLENPFYLIRGIPFSASLLLILGTHEFGHYFASKRHGVDTTLPMFIPAPPIPFLIGTFGAVIKMPRYLQDGPSSISAPQGPLQALLSPFL